MSLIIERQDEENMKGILQFLYKLKAMQQLESVDISSCP